jgi:hypothetical protein|tara:strand:- start:37 stop:258 length:222 start_codon:yes stop_codon:yes gene_type:complete
MVYVRIYGLARETTGKEGSRWRSGQGRDVIKDSNWPPIELGYNELESHFEEIGASDAVIDAFKRAWQEWRGSE